ncbi:isocitrate/isopropylmalate family dehydrogenase [Niabella drilacis]|uniref:3-isopropylmalate dehydrogenase n=1 Tax=Niabella drilacis (strain DSM 25811 / CCM 8410 / CCUG 62505 / LMG 26954 / E90) TaxID=1285928 RepID=A0A1G6SZS3_NIADE|nr:isocitrate/isopropylmalate family dehydrogenase [Niabella drilacis]SDD22288.1 3-isopropylmalate dehydrogenase [Niabella drilacis]
MKKNIAIIEEAGAAGEVNAQVEKVIRAVAEQYDHYFDIAPISHETVNQELSAPLQQSASWHDAVLFSSIASQHFIDEILPLLVIVQPVTVYPSLQHLSPLKPKYSEGLNLLLYQQQDPGADENDRLRIAQSALQQAINRRKKITVIVHPQDHTEQPWPAIFEKAGTAFKEISIETIPVQEAWDRMLQQPAGFDTLVAGAAAGGYLFSQAAAITGARFMIPSVRVADTIPFFGPAFGFDHQQASARNQSNPVGAILSVAMMMDYFNLHEEALIIRTAVSWTLLHGFVSKDIDSVNNYSTGTIGDLISDFIRGTIPGFAKGENMALQKSTII